MPRESKTPTSPSAAVRCEGLIVEFGTSLLSAGRALTLARQVVKEVLPGSWSVSRFAGTPRSFEVAPVGRRNRTVGKYWEYAGLLRSHRDVSDAEPVFVLPGADPVDRQVFTRGERVLQPKSAGSGPPLPCSAGFEWPLEHCKVSEAWEATPADRRFAQGIRVAHPDTGYTDHPDFFSTRVRASWGRDFEDDDTDPRDDLVGAHPGHGAATGSVIMSDQGPDGVPHVTGVAPLAELIPLRVSTSVIHLNFSKLAASLHFASRLSAARRPHVISMSLGGPFKSRFLRRALAEAIGAGMIPIAAAGNKWKWVVYPAKYSEVVAVAASNCRQRPWSGSARGKSVDISAPGESVWRAKTKRGPQFTVERSDGTSYATAMTAGACALWLARHGHSTLSARYGAGLAATFKEVLKQHGVRTPTGWKTKKYGAGILDVEKLMLAPLPATPPAAPAAKAFSSLGELGSYFEDMAPSTLRKAVRQALQSSDSELDDDLVTFGDELEFHVATNPRFRALIETLASPSKKKAMPKKAPKAKLLGKAASKSLKERLGN